MSTTHTGPLHMQVKAGETGLVRLFAVDLPANEAIALSEQPDGLAGLLGIPSLDPTHFEVFAVGDLAGLGLEAYLEEGHGIPAEDLAPHRWQIDALDGVVVILRSAAILKKPDTLAPHHPLRWIATFGEAAAPVPLRAHLPSASAKGILSSTATAQNSPNLSRLALLLAVTFLGVLALVLYMLVQ